MKENAKDEKRKKQNMVDVKQEEILTVIRKINEQKIDNILKDRFHDFCKEYMGINPISYMSEPEFKLIKRQVEEDSSINCFPDQIKEKGILFYSFGIFHSIAVLKYSLDWIKSLDKKNIKIIDEIKSKFFNKNTIADIFDKQRYYSLDRNESYREENETMLKGMFPFINNLDKFSFIVAQGEDEELNKEKIFEKSSEIKEGFIFYAHGCFSVFAAFSSFVDALSYEKMFLQT